MNEKAVVCFGDSITAGRRLSDDSRWSALLQRHLTEITGCPWQVFNRGVPSDTASLGLARFEKDVAPHLPAWVLVEFGLNDCSHLEGRCIPRVGATEFGVLLGEIIRLVRVGGGSPVLLTNHLPGTHTEKGRRARKHLAPYQHVIRETAASCCCDLIDLEKSLFDAVTSGDLLAEDEIHLSEDGQGLYAAAVGEAFEEILKSSGLGKLPSAL